jgi:arylsulfatase A-like enzyme
VQAGTRITEAVSLASLPSTVLELAGLPSQLPGDPIPLSNPMRASDGPPLLAEFSTLRKGPVLKALMDDHWHYILNVQTGAELLFDLTTDPTELHNVAANSANGAVLEGFRSRLKQLFPNGFKHPVNGE